MTRSLALLLGGIALAGCSGSGDMMRAAVPTIPLQFESTPAGAEVKTAGGQTCKTPCALAIPAADMQVTFTLNGYQPQTVPVKLVPPEPGDFTSPPRFDPSPVTAELVKARRAPARKSQAKAAKRPPAEPANAGGSGFSPPPQAPAQSPANGGFPPIGQQPNAAPPSSGWPSPSR